MNQRLLHEVMLLAWQFVKQNGLSMSEALKCSWANTRLKEEMRLQIVKFHYRKVNGTIREGYGTLNEKLIPVVTRSTKRKKNSTVQVYYDTEVCEFRCFKKVNLINTSMA